MVGRIGSRGGVPEERGAGHGENSNDRNLYVASFLLVPTPLTSTCASLNHAPMFI